MEQMRLAWAQLDGCSGHEVGRKLLAQLYREQTGAEHPPIQKEARGKPYFQNSSLHFSISHTKKHAFCVLAPFRVGIDAEEKDRKVDLRFVQKVLSPAEYDRFEKAADQKAAFLRMWVLKEAAVKLTGDGLRGYPNGTDFDPQDTRISEIDGCYVAILKE